MFEPKIKLDKELYDRLIQCAATLGYSSTEEFINHTLEKAASDCEAAMADLDEDASDEEVRKRLQGLGYLG